MTAEPTEAGLIAGARAGDAEALAGLFRRYADQVHEVALRITASTHDAEDVTQTVFMGLPEALSAFSGSGDLGAWIRRVATRTALLFLRQRRRQARWETDAGREAETTAPPAEIEARMTLERALNRMPDDLRVVYILKEMEGYSHDEIADELGISTGASTVRLHRARRFLKDRLQGRI